MSPASLLTGTVAPTGTRLPLGAAHQPDETAAKAGEPVVRVGPGCSHSRGSVIPEEVTAGGRPAVLLTECDLSEKTELARFSDKEPRTPGKPVLRDR